jgi:hypothetical protein
MAREAPYTELQVQNVALSLLNMLEDPALGTEVETIRTLTRRFLEIVGDTWESEEREQSSDHCRQGNNEDM